MNTIRRLLMMASFLTVSCTNVPSTATTHAPQCTNNATADQVESAKAKALADPGLKSTTTQDGYLKVEIEKPDGSIILSYFTLQGHPAHPANVTTAIYESEGQVWMYTKGFTAGNCVTFEQWMKGFEQQHEQVREQFRKRGS